MTDLPAAVVAKLRELHDETDPHPGEWCDHDCADMASLTDGARIGRASAFEEAADLFQDRDCDAGWDNGEACPEDIEDHEKCTPCLVEHRLRQRAIRAAKERP